jgi:hypothetical protein
MIRQLRKASLGKIVISYVCTRHRVSLSLDTRVCIVKFISPNK